MSQQVDKAIEVLKDGGIVIFPTDTAFGIGCRVDNEKAVEKLFKIRKRPESQAVPVLVDTVKMARDYVEEVPNNVLSKLIEPYWPGALTIILKAKADKVPLVVRGGKDTVGLRIPNHPIAREIIRGVGTGILGPSANFHGEKTPYKVQELNKELIKLVDFVVEGECTVCKESTVVDCSKEPWDMVRDGAIKVDEK